MFRVNILLIFLCIPLVAIAGDDEIYFELLSLSNYKIPMQNNSCEVEKKDYRVGDFLTAYLQLMAKNTQNINTYLSCDDSVGANCTFGYGNKPKWFGNENWISLLRFEYDFKSKKIDRATLKCIDLP